MKPVGSVFLFCLLAIAPLHAQGTHPGGIVYGPKAAFKIDAPKGWVLDNNAGVEQGLPCVLYPKGSSWEDAHTIMYAKIASTAFTSVDQFAARSIKEMERVHGLPREKVATGQTGDGKPFFINEYPATESYSQWEQAAYIQLPGAVAYIILSSKDESSFHHDAAALKEVLKSFAYMEVKNEKQK
jgi:hypothetical protein